MAAGGRQIRHCRAASNKRLTGPRNCPFPDAAEDGTGFALTGGMIAKIAKLSPARQRLLFVSSGFLSSAPFFYALIWLVDDWSRLEAAGMLTPALVICVASLVGPILVFWGITALVFHITGASSDLGQSDHWLEPVIKEHSPAQTAQTEVKTVTPMCASSSFCTPLGPSTQAATQAL